jgi:enoyl-CoA hydratase
VADLRLLQLAAAGSNGRAQVNAQGQLYPDRMPAERALEVGLVNQVFDSHESLVSGALDIAGRIAKRSPLAVWGTKEMINYTRDHSVADGLRYMAGWQSGMFQPRDMLEEFAAKGEGRDPEFDALPSRPTSI